MSSKFVRFITSQFTVYILFLVIVVVLFLVNLNFSKSINNIAAVGAATVLSIIGAIAVVIERIIEGFWSFMDVLKKYQWPLSNDLFSTRTSNINNKLTEIVKSAEDGIETLKNGDATAQAKIPVLNSALQELKKNYSSLTASGGGIRNPGFENFTTATMNSIGVIQKNLPEIENASKDLGTVLADSLEFIDTFKDNPGRRLFSILLGMCLGLIITLITGLDVFQATLGTQGTNLFSWTTLKLGIALTGIVMGLGSSPTHEVIQLLNEIKTNHANQN